MRTAPVIVAFVILAACASSAPPKAAEPEPAPLVIPPLPPQKEAEPRPAPREAVTVGGFVEPDGPLTTPGALALPCNTDAECMTHRCNMRFAKCAFPCKTDRDCIAGSTCYTQGGAMATCIPKPVP